MSLTRQLRLSSRFIHPAGYIGKRVNHDAFIIPGLLAMFSGGDEDAGMIDGNWVAARLCPGGAIDRHSLAVHIAFSG